MDITTRGQWDARYPAGFDDAGTASEVWLHHSAGLAPDLVFTDLNRDSVDDDEATVMRRLEDIGQQRFRGGISYPFVVMPSGRVYEGTGPFRRGAHTGGRNSFASAICLPGNYETRHVTDQQLAGAAALLRHGVEQQWWKTARLNGGHRQAPGAETACPGRNGMAAIPLINHLAQEDDMPLNQDDLNAISVVVRDWARDALLFPVIDWGTHGRTSVAQQLAENGKGLAAQAGRLAALEVAVVQLAAGQGVDPDVIREAARSGTAEAIESITVNVRPSKES